MTKKKILVTGASGQLGNELKVLAVEFPFFDFIFASRADLDLSSSISINNFFSQNKIDICINTAAYTAVDKAESEPELAFNINAHGVKLLAENCSKINAKLIHISTDFVFDGLNYMPYIEVMPTNPQSVYGSSKLKGEEFVISHDAIIIRTSWLYSSFGNNFVKTMLRLASERSELSVIFDQVGTPTYAADLASTILHICSNKKYLNKSGIYHYSNEGVASWYDFTKAIFEYKNIDCKVHPIITQQYPTPASRPHYSVLNKFKFKSEFHLDVPYWRDSLQKCLKLM
jgi:dTDP-4-dehydrorhamnose reductase